MSLLSHGFGVYCPVTHVKTLGLVLSHNPNDNWKNVNEPVGVCRIFFFPLREFRIRAKLEKQSSHEKQLSKLSVE